MKTSDTRTAKEPSNSSPLQIGSNLECVICYDLLWSVWPATPPSSSCCCCGATWGRSDPKVPALTPKTHTPPASPLSLAAFPLLPLPSPPHSLFLSPHSAGRSALLRFLSKQTLVGAFFFHFLLVVSQKKLFLS